MRSSFLRSRADWRFFVVVGVGLLLRLVYVLNAARADPMFHQPVMDGLFHHQWALAIVRGGWLADMPFFRAPLYPYFLALVYKVLGANLLFPRIVQALLGAASCGLVCLLGRRIFKPLVGLAAGLAAAAYPLLIYFDGELLIPPVLILLVLGGIVLLYWCQQKDRLWFLPGVVFGLAAITRPNVLAFVFLTPVWFWLEYRRGLLKRLLPFGIAVVAAIVPVTVRNFVVSRELIPIAWQAGTNFAIGNNPYSDGITAVLPGTRKDWWGGFNDVRRIAEEVTGRELGYSEIDRFWMGKGLEFWKASPGQALLLLLRKLYLFFAGYEIANNRDIYFFSGYSFLKFLMFNVPLLQFPFGLLVPLAGVGFYFSRKSWRKHLPIYLFVAGYAASFVPFFVTARYRLPLVPLLLPFAVAGVVGLYRSIRGRKGRVVPVVLLVGLLVLLNANLAGVKGVSRAQVYAGLAEQRIRQGRLGDAEALLRRAQQADSTWPDNYYIAGLLRMSRGDRNGADSAFRAALGLDSTKSDIWIHIGDLRASVRRLDSARMYYERALQLDPYSAFAWGHLGNVFYTQGEFDKALDAYKKAAGLMPDYTTPLYNSGLIYYRRGQVDSARQAWRQVLLIDPADTLARRRLAESVLRR